VGDVEKLYGPKFGITLEEYFTQLEAMFQTARRAAGLPRGYRDVDLAEMRLRAAGRPVGCPRGVG
jgi:hypothetical protein